MIIDAIYCINLKNDTERWNNILNNAANANINIIRFDAIIKKNATYANTLSHTNLWKNIKKKYNNIIILEDDAIIPNNFLNKINNIPNINYDIIFLGGGYVHGSLYNNLIIPNIVEKNECKNIGFFAYIINCKSINKLLKIVLPYSLPIDISIRNATKNLIIYYSYPHIIKHNFKFQSTRLIIDYNKKYYSNNIINNYHKITINNKINFNIINNNKQLKSNAFYFIIKYINSLPNNWKYIIIKNNNIVKYNHIIIYRNYDSNIFYTIDN
jgi:GR25 family glycosyltransferase involved in LPS biosynthesis